MSEEESGNSPSSGWTSDIRYGRTSHLSEIQNIQELRDFTTSLSDSCHSETNQDVLKQKLKQLEKENERLRRKVDSNQTAISQIKRFVAKKDHLKQTNDVLQDNICELTVSKSITEFQLQQLQKEHDNEAEKNEEKQTALQVDNNILKQQLHMAQLKVIEQEEMINKLSKQQMRIKNDNDKSQNDLLKLKQKHQLIIDQIPNNTRERAMLAEANKKIEEQNLLMQRYHKQLKAVAKVFELKNFNVDKDWNKVIDVAVEVKYKATRVESLEEENKRLNHDLEITLEELNGIQEKKKTESVSKTNDGVKDALQKMLHQERQQNIMNSTIIMKLRSKALFTKVIESSLHTTVKQVNELHSSLHKSNASGFKSLIFTVILIKQFYSRKTINYGEDLIGTIWGNNSHSRIECQLKDLRVIFSRISEDLLQTRNDLQTSKEKNKKTLAKLESCKQMTHSSNDSTARYEKKCKSLKRKIDEQQNIITHLVDPSLYASVAKALDEETNISNELKNRVVQLEENIHIKEQEVIEVKKECEDIQIKLNAAHNSVSKIAEEMKSKDKDINILNNLLKSKSSEILALERIVTRQTSIQTTKDVAMELILHKESQQLISNGINFIPQTGRQNTIGEFTGIQYQVNPAFLRN